ncbi:MAG: hypothetical protein AB1861_08410 [Cyanobacteriota bacterium]
MPFTNEHKWRICNALRLNRRDIEKVQACLKETQEESEVQVEQALQILKDLESANSELVAAGTADAGLVQAGALKWSEDKLCQIKCTRNDLRYQLAAAIGYELPCPISF